jgi:hypothetical protein
MTAVRLARGRTVAALAIHLSCCLSTSRERRRRTIIAGAAASNPAAIPSHPKGDISTKGVLDVSTPQGLTTPLNGASSRTGSSAEDNVVTQVAALISQKTTNQPREIRCPSGKSKNSKAGAANRVGTTT